MSSAVRSRLSALRSRMDTARAAGGPLGALPALSAAARRALAVTAVLALLNAGALVAQAFLFASVLADIVSGQATGYGRRLLILGAVVFVRAVVGWTMRVVAARAAAGAKQELRTKAVDHALRLGPEWVARRGPGELTALTTKGLDALDAYFTDYLPALVTAAVVPIGIGAAVLVVDWPSAVIIALTVPLLPVFAILVGIYTADRVGTATDAVHRMSGHLLELVRALPVLAAFRRAESQARVIRHATDRHRTATLSTLRLAFSSAFVLELAATLSVALVAVVIGLRLVSGDLSLAIGLGVLILAPECYQPLRSVGSAFHASQDGVEAVRRVADVLAEPVSDPGTARPGKGTVAVHGLRVRRRNGFAPDGQTWTVRPGSTVWLKSASGAGKTTTLSVLLGFVQPDSGTVTIAGTPLEDIDMSEWRESVAWVPQTPAFTGGTVRAELELAAPRAALDAHQIDEVLARLDLIGLDQTPVHRLSVGQRQRVAVARALLRVHAGAWLLLLDEPVAHLDAVNAERVLSAVREAERAGAAVVIAAHDHAALDTGTDTGQRPDRVPEQAGSGRALSLRELAGRRLFAGVVLGAAALLAGVALTATSGWLIAKASQQPPILTLTVAVVGVRAFGLARAGLRYAERLITHDAAFRIAGQLRERLWSALVRRGPAHTFGLHRGEGARRLVDDVDTVRDLLPRAVTPPLVVAVVVIGASVIQIGVLPQAGLALLAAMIVGVLSAPMLALVLERRATARMATGRRVVATRTLELFDGVGELIAFGAHRARRDELVAADDRLRAAAGRQAFGAGAAEALITLVTGCAAVLSTGMAARAAVAGELDPVLAPLLALVPLALAEVLSLLPPVAQHWDVLRQSRIRLASILTDPGGSAGRGVRHDSGRIVLRSAGLRWPGAADAVLRDIDLDIPEGTWVAVVGPSGAGKSTLLAALLGQLDPEWGQAELPERVSWAPQEPQLVSTTVAENLRLADPHADEEQLHAALATAGIPDLTPDVYLDSAGAGLSGGQAQRVALARAVLAAQHADLVLLDEPTAHLDEATADDVLTNLRRTLRGKTVVHVTHRQADTLLADVVLDVQHGQVVTQGTALPSVR